MILQGLTGVYLKTKWFGIQKFGFINKNFKILILLNEKNRSFYCNQLGIVNIRKSYHFKGEDKNAHINTENGKKLKKMIFTLILLDTNFKISKKTLKIRPIVKSLLMECVFLFISII